MASGTVVGKIIAPVLLVSLFLSGVIDMMVIKNDSQRPLFGTKSAAVEWIGDNTAKDAVFLTDPRSLYMEPTLAGRRLYLGYIPWTRVAGYAPNPATIRNIVH